MNKIKWYMSHNAAVRVFQRAVRGYDYRAVEDPAEWLSATLPLVLRELADKTTGYPQSLNTVENQLDEVEAGGYDNMMNIWRSTLRFIAAGIENACYDTRRVENPVRQAGSDKWIAFEEQYERARLTTLKTALNSLATYWDHISV